MMKSRLFIILQVSFILCLVNNYVVAQSYTAVKDVDGLKKKLKETSESIKSIQCEFNQEKKMNILEGGVHSKGKFYYQETNKIRWEIITPDPYIVVINGYKMMVQNKSKVKTYDTKSHKMFGRINEIMMATIKGSFGEENGDYTEEYKESKEYYLLKLTPVDKDAKKYLSGIEIYFDKKLYDVVTIKMIELEGDYTEISFFNKTINGAIDDKVFQLSK